MIDITLPEQDFINESISQATSKLLDAFQVEKETKFLSEGITEDNDDVSEGITIGHDLLGRPVFEGDDESFRVIDTGLTKDEDLEVLQSVIGQLSDGIWENSRAMEHFWPFVDAVKENGKVVLKIKQTHYSPIARNSGNNFFGMSDNKVKEWFANKVKAVVKEEGQLWKRENTSKLDYMGGHTCAVTVRDAYRVYDKLKGRKDYIKDSEQVNEAEVKFSKALFNKIRKHMPGRDASEFYVADMNADIAIVKRYWNNMKMPGIGGVLSDLLAFQDCQFIAFWTCTTTDLVNPDLSFASDTTSKQQFETAVERACADMGIETTVVQAWPLTLDYNDILRCYYAVPIFVK